MTRHGSDLYVLDDEGRPIQLDRSTPDYELIWARFFEQHDRRIVQQDVIGPYWVSTIFLGIDHAWGGGAPVLWETMVFADKKLEGDGFPIDFDQRRYRSREDAIAGHVTTCQLVRLSLEQPATGARAGDDDLPHPPT
jgi:hypothetical protein